MTNSLLATFKSSLWSWMCFTGLSAESHRISVTALSGPQVSPHLKLPGLPFWVSSGFIKGEDRQISPSSPVPALAKLLCCLEAFSGIDFKVTGTCSTHCCAEWSVCAVHRLCWVVRGQGRYWVLCGLTGQKRIEDFTSRVYHLCRLMA